MAKYLVAAKYHAPDGYQGLLKEGGARRLDAVLKLIQGMGGTLEVMYFAFGDYDLYAVVETPSAAAMAAIALNVNASGTVTVTTTPLITLDEMDAAVHMWVNYRPPGASSGPSGE